MKIKFNIILALSILLPTYGIAANQEKAPLVENQDYKLVAGAKASKEPLVVEFFSYHCPACYSTEPFVERWLKTKPETVKFKQIPLYIPSAKHLAKAYYVAELFKVKHQVHMDIFNTWHRDKKVVRRKEDLIPIFERAGISKEKFEKAYNSFAVDSKIQYAKSMMKKLKVTGIPTFIVNNQYKIERANVNFQNYRLLNELPIEKLK